MSTIAASSATPATATQDVFLSLNQTDRLGSKGLNYFKMLFGLPSQRRLARGALMVDQVRHWESQFDRLSDDEVLRTGQHLRGRARGGESLDRMLPEAFGLCCVAAKRTVGLRPFDVQIAAGVVLHQRALAEVATGEGKTLIATLPASLNALVGKGVHVTTVNDYLARRDGEWTSRIYRAMGLSVGILAQQMPDGPRKKAYQCDITYGTSSEFGFDFLRDRMKVRGDKTQALPFWAPWTSNGQLNRPLDPKVQRGHHFALVDEADNIFIDEARTPLIIAGPRVMASEEESVVFYWADDVARKMVRNQHFFYDDKRHKIELAEEGRKLIRYSNPPVGEHSHAMDKLHEHVERALHSHFRFRRDVHYMVEDDKVVIIDESTGRRMPDRSWSEGLHQAVEAKEKVPIQRPSDHAAKVTYQSYFRLYDKLCGMTGTAAQAWAEIRRVYKLWVVCVPTNKRCIRKHLPDKVFPNMRVKFDAIADEVVRLHQLGRPVLIGTKSVEGSEMLSERLNAAGVEHQILNARPDIADREAEIVSQAGRRGAVTIATNMAGRGTDILLGGNPEPIAWSLLKDRYRNRLDVPDDVWKKLVADIEDREKITSAREEVRQLGGLHVLGAERNESLRIDRQLQGRAARQGDPGSAQFFISLDDDLLEGLGPERQQRVAARGEKATRGNWNRYLPLFFHAQKRLELRHYRQRFDLMMYEKNRQEVLKDLGADPYVD